MNKQRFWAAPLLGLQLALECYLISQNYQVTPEIVGYVIGFLLIGFVIAYGLLNLANRIKTRWLRGVCFAVTFALCWRLAGLFGYFSAWTAQPRKTLLTN
ncbi:hypothetical protein ACF1UB_002714 [Vibrio fluvialis]